MMTDIPLAQAIVCMDLGRENIRVLRAPDAERLRDGYAFVFGACDPFWADIDDNQRCGELLIELWQAAVLNRASPASFHAALVVIPEYRDLMPPDLLPRKLRR